MRRILIVPVIAGLLLTLGACGAKEETSTAGPSAKSSDSDQTTTTKAAPSDDETGDESDSGSDSGTGGVSDLPSGLDNDCIALSTLYVTVMAQSTTALVPGGMESDELDQLADDLEEAKSKAEIPDELADAFDTWSAAWTEFSETMSEMGEGGILDPANAEKLQEASERIDDPEVEAAGDKIEAYVTEHCAGGTVGTP